jgi:hypothetical protein
MGKLLLVVVGAVCSAHPALPFVNNGKGIAAFSLDQISIVPELTTNQLIILGLFSLTALAIFLQRKLR